MRGRWLLGTVVAIVLVASACTPRPAAIGGDPCLVGEYRLSSQELLRPLHSPVGSVTLAGGVGGRTLSIRADGTSSVSADGSDPITVTGTDVSGSVLIAATGTGTWTTSAGARVDLAVTGLTGTVTFDGSVAGTPQHIVLDLGVSGLGDAIAPKGSATYTCGDALTLRTGSVTWTWTRA